MEKRESGFKLAEMFKVLGFVKQSWAEAEDYRSQR
jgi:hypothetical protein